MKLSKDLTALNEEQLLYQLAKSQVQTTPRRRGEKVVSGPTKEVVRITSAKELTNDEKMTILTAVGHVIPYDEDKVQYRIDPDLIAGVRVQSSSYFYDNSLERKLKDLDVHLQRQITIE